MADRLARLKDAMRLEWGELASALQINRTMLHYLRKGQRNPSIRALRRIEDAEQKAGLVPPPVKQREAPEPAEIPDERKVEKSVSGPLPVRMVPVYGLAQALGARVHHGDLVPDGEYHLDKVPILDDGRPYAAFRVEGNSMAPALRDGMVALCDLNREPSNGCVVVAKWDDTVSIKRYRRVGTKVLLTSDNRADGEGKDFEVRAKDLQWCLRVVRFIGEM